MLPRWDNSAVIWLVLAATGIAVTAVLAASALRVASAVSFGLASTCARPRR